jgi:hypothetical protein
MKYLSAALRGALALSVPSTTTAFLSPATQSIEGSAAAAAANTIRQSSSLSLKKRGEGYGPPLDNISQTVGNTPLVKISDRIAPPGRTIYAKCEFFNPLSSVKDRLALSIIEAAEKDGSLKPGMTVVEATSGNTGIGKCLTFEKCCNLCKLFVNDHL